MVGHERAVRILSPDDNRSFTETGREEVHTVEAYEKRVHGENVEPTRQFSTNSYTERRTFGRDENGEVVVRIDKNPRDPVKPVSPVRPFGALSKSGEQTLRPLPNLETTPLHIPRVNTPSKNATLSPGSIQWHDQVSPRSVASIQHSPRSGRSSGFGSSPHSATDDQPIAANVPMKKITRKSRLVSIYDGRPVSEYVEKTHFEAADPEDLLRPSSRLSSATYHDPLTYKNNGVVLNAAASSSHSPRSERFIPIYREKELGQRPIRQDWQHKEHPHYSSSNKRREEESSGGVLIMENPLFSNY